MKNSITQSKAKILIRDYLRETGRKGVTSLMRDLRRHAKTEIFAQRTLEKWLKEKNRQLQDEHWDLVQGFIASDKFKAMVPYANEGSVEKRLNKVAEGFISLYSDIRHPKGIYILPSVIKAEGARAVSLLNGYWENEPNQRGGDVLRTICCMEAVPDARYAKFAYMALLRSRQISATGLVIYVSSEEYRNYDYCHNFVLQLWRRRDPDTGSSMPGGLTFLTYGDEQPEFEVSDKLNNYFYKVTALTTKEGGVTFNFERQSNPLDLTAVGELAAERKFKKIPPFEKDSMALKNSIVLRRLHFPIPEDKNIIDQLIEDVLPHGYNES